jgi:hypothetical protein
MANGVLGCYNAPNREITMIQGWNWYAGSDPTQIGANQYDFETTVLHELGHALGLGGSTNPSSPMYEILAAGVADRTPTAQDLNIPDPPSGADPLTAAGFASASTPLALSPNGFAAALGSGPNLSPAGLMPLPPAGGTSSGVQFSVFSFQYSVASSQVSSQGGSGSSLVSQTRDHENEHGHISWVLSESTDFSGRRSTCPRCPPSPRRNRRPIHRSVRGIIGCSMERIAAANLSPSRPDLVLIRQRIQPWTSWLPRWFSCTGRRRRDHSALRSFP